MHAEIQDIDPYLVYSFLYSVGSPLASELKNNTNEILLQMGLISEPPEMRKPRNVALMFFNNSPEKYFSYTQIESVDKPDPSEGNMTETIFKGPLDKQIIAALQFIHGYVIKERIKKTRQ